jgi:hypothetical protein
MADRPGQLKVALLEDDPRDETLVRDHLEQGRLSVDPEVPVEAAARTR